jgi:predicted molibdopterin-dependent oxidoreductase YjgC
MEGRIQSFESAVPLPGEAKPDWEILNLLGKRMASTDQYQSIQQVRFEIASLVPGYMDLARSQGAAWVGETSPQIRFSAYSPLPLESV